MGQTLQQYLAQMNKDCRFLGKGMHSWVFDHPRDPRTVVKVSVGDLPYQEAFIPFCFHNQGNRWLPRIQAFDTLDLEDAKACLILIERLQPTNWSMIERAIQEINPTIDQDRFSIKCRMSYPEWVKTSQESQDEDTKVLAKFCARHFGLLDLTDKNFMRRGPQVVFSDPVCLP